MIQTKQLKDSNGTIEYLTAGEGPPLVLLPGAGCSATFNWQPTLERLQSNYKMIAISLPGSGGTSWNKDTIALDELVTAVKACTDQERFDSFSLIGYSAGAIVALATSSKLPMQVNKVMAIAPWRSCARQSFLFDLWCKLIPMEQDCLARVNALFTFSMNSQLSMNAEAFEGAVQITLNTGANSDFLKFMNALKVIDIMPYLTGIKSRTNVIGFTHDLMAPVQHAKAIADYVKDVAFTEIAAGHAGFWEASELLNVEIDSFLKFKAINEHFSGKVSMH
jgi:pimeloyl-ACP methyl ester carboxylesterase